MKQKISVIIPNLNSPVIDLVINAIISQSDPEYDLCIFVVGYDSHGKIPIDHRVFRITTPGPVFPGVARNLGAEQARSDVLIFLDADCIPQPGWLKALIDSWKNNPDAGAISGAMLPYSSGIFQNFEQISRFHEYIHTNPAGERRALPSFSLLVPYRVWKDSGGFDPQLRAAEDIDFTIRLRKRGWKLIFEPNALVYHCISRSSLKDFLVYSYLNGFFSIQVRKKHNDIYKLPRLMFNPFVWYIGAVFIGVLRSIQIYITTPSIRKYWYYWPMVAVSKIAWCYGAGGGLRFRLTSKGVVSSNRVDV